MDHMKEGDEPRFTTSALTAPTSRETSRTFARHRHTFQGGPTLILHFKLCCQIKKTADLFCDGADAA